MRSARKQWPTTIEVIVAWELCGRNASAASRKLHVSGNLICKILRAAGYDTSSDKTRSRMNRMRNAAPKATVTGARVVMGHCASGSK